MDFAPSINYSPYFKSFSIVMSSESKSLRRESLVILVNLPPYELTIIILPFFLTNGVI